MHHCHRTPRRSPRPVAARSRAVAGGSARTLHTTAQAPTQSRPARGPDRPHASSPVSSPSHARKPPVQPHSLVTKPILFTKGSKLRLFTPPFSVRYRRRRHRCGRARAGSSEWTCGIAGASTLKCKLETMTFFFSPRGILIMVLSDGIDWKSRLVNWKSRLVGFGPKQLFKVAAAGRAGRACIRDPAKSAKNS